MLSSSSNNIEKYKSNENKPFGSCEVVTLMYLWSVIKDASY